MSLFSDNTANGKVDTDKAEIKVCLRYCILL